MTCKWCYSEAVWQAHTPRHGEIDLCQAHYDDVEHERRAHILRGLSGKALQICQDFHNWKG